MILQKNIRKYNPNWTLPNHPYKILMIGGSQLQEQMYYLI